MSVEEQDYQLEVLEYAVNQCIDRLLPSSSEDDLSVILYQSNELVWRVATDIYSKSGYQIAFLFIKDILNLRIEPLRRKIVEEERIRKEQEAEQARIRAEQERIRKEQEAEQAQIRAEQERIRKEQEAEQARIRAERERIRKEQEAEQARIRAERERIRKEQEAEQARIRAEQERIRKEQEQRKLQEFREEYPDIDINIFFKIKKIIVEALMVEEEQVKPDSILFKDLGADTLDIVELIQEIEKEFDIEIPDNFKEIPWISGRLGDYSKLESITVKKVLDIVCEKIQYQ